jgi:hypothetical protein
MSQRDCENIEFQGLKCIVNFIFYSKMNPWVNAWYGVNILKQNWNYV